MTKQEQTKQMLKILCDKFQCSAIDRSYIAKSCRQCEDIVETLHEAGYGDISEYKAEIERLVAEFKQLETNAEILAWGVRDLNHENYELTEKIKQAQIDVLNKVKNYIDDKIENDYSDMSDSVEYLTINIDEFDDFIDELIEEIEKQ